MTIVWGPIGSTDGLVLALDAANPKSNFNVSTGWYDVGPTRSYIGASGGPTLGTRDGAQCMVFDALGERFQSSPVGFISPAITLTLEAWIYPEADLGSPSDRMNIIRANSGGSRAYLSLNRSNNKLSNYWYGSDNDGYHETVSFVPGRNTWQHFVGAWDGTTLRQYVNYEHQGSVATNTSNSTFGTEIQIGWEGNGRQFVGGIALIRVYNKALSDEEVFHNFSSTKGRFGF